MPSLVVLHYTAMRDATSARARLCDPQAEVSAHWLIDEAGRAEALVAEKYRAWHAGAGSWKGQGDVNSRSIGIEIANPGDRPFPAAQMDALIVLMRGIMARWSIGPEGVIGHSDMAPGRKSDPGPRFDWQRLAREGLALWPDRPAEGELDESLDLIGYPQCDADARLAAFRLRFRPWARGPRHRDDVRWAAAVAALVTHGRH
ncbi:N-acetylmuramoyl-L-alanine amidase [Paracoccus sp. Z330]|uniref:N-acetylmuramoyl-L-alanine amidase n=1 Tax=Paracoccus onchidii TaxID=3017813 RepID=A0ABT4ZKR8_9RHOB|nr:N-acetylmuramoyl-L-alanine amidase [Paracoccus onchidii]MDB6179325.1 N-acetylmuramoyl-L-alanine amidase [Paracoccus onchidii]